MESYPDGPRLCEREIRAILQISIRRKVRLPPNLQAKTSLFEHTQVVLHKAKTLGSCCSRFFRSTSVSSAITDRLYHQTEMGLTDDFDEDDRP